jgi:hypothetical protein
MSFSALRTGLLGLMLLVTSLAEAQYFGRNKPTYKRLDFKVVKSPNFSLYHYFQNKEDAVRLLQDSERWYKLHQQVLQDTIAGQNPIIFYKNHADFQQTTAINSSINVGTGGVTEALKNRVIMPVTLSNKQTDHVLGHELVHAFQYNMILKTGDSTSLNSLRNLPLFMIEGLAEYMSIGSVDPNTAMWMRDAVLHDKIPTLKDLTTNSRFFPYRWGQVFWSFVAGTWGDNVIEPLFMNTAKYGYEAAIERSLNVKPEIFSQMWKSRLKSYYEPFIAQADSIPTGYKLLHKDNAGDMNISPVLSPNGQFIAYLSEQNILGLDLFLADAKTGKVIRRLASLTTNDHLDNFNFLESAGTWSPYGDRFAFVVFGKGRNQLAIVDVARGKIVETLDIPGVDAFSYPSWSPDGERIVVSGLVEGKSDLYLYNIRTKKVQQLTQDLYSDLMPSWSADGKHIVFSTDRPTTTEIEKSLSYNLAEIDVNTGNVSVIDAFAGADNVNPVYEPSSGNIIFLSDRDGFRNMYRYKKEDRQVQSLTNYATGISGITALSPALSIARTTPQVAYSYYNNGKYTVYTAPVSAFNTTTVRADSISRRAAVLPPSRHSNPVVNQNLASMSLTAPIVPADSIREAPYKPEFKLDHISNSAGVGASSGPFGTGLQGGVNMIFSDVLGANQLFAAASINGEVYDFGAQAAYLRQKGRFHWGAMVGHVPFMSARIGYTTDSLQIGDKKQQVNNVILEKTRIFQQQLNLIGNYVISTTRRFEFGTGVSRYSYRVDRLNTYYYNGFFVKSDQERIKEVPDPFHFEQAFVAYVGDNSYFGLTSPLAGRRYRLHAEQYFGDFDVFTGLADYRQYIFVKPFALAFRAMYQARVGKDAENGRLAPLSIAHPTFIRGFANDYVTKSQQLGKENISYSNLYGSRIAVANAELRLPLTGPEKLAMFKSGFLFSDLNFFVDAGMAWSQDRTFIEGPNVSPSMAAKPLISAGASLRVNLFGYLIVEPFYAIPLEKNGLKLANFGLNLAPGW